MKPTPFTTGEYISTFAKSDHLGEVGKTKGTNQADIPLIVGTPIEGDLVGTPDSDVYQFTLVAGETYIFTLVGSGANPLGDPWLALYNNGDGRIISDDNSGSGHNATIVYTAAYSTSNFTIYVQSSAGTQGHYTLNVTTGGPVDTISGDTYGPGATPGTVTFGQTTTSTLTAPRDVDWFKVELTAGVVYDLTFAGQAVDGLAALEGGTAILYSYNADYSRYDSYTYISTLNEGSGHTFIRVTTGGTYYVAVSVNQNLGTDAANYGGYAITLGSDINDIDRNGPAVATIGQDISSTLTGFETDTFTYHLVGGKVYEFTVNDGGYTSSTLTVGSVTSAGTNNPNHLIFKAATTGDYNLMLASPYQEDYKLHSEVRPADLAGDATTTGRLTLGQSTRGNADFSRDVDWYAIDLTAGQTYFFNVNPRFSYASFGLQLVKGDGTVVAGSAGTLHDYVIENAVSTFAFTATATGTYYVYVKDWWGYADDSNYLGSDYVVRADQVPDLVGRTQATAAALPLGQVVDGVIDFNTDEDWYALQVTGGYTYSIANMPVSGESYQPIALVGGAYVNAAGNDVGFRFTATQNGTVYVRVGAPPSPYNVVKNEILNQPYHIKATLLDTIAGDTSTTATLALGQTITGTIDFTSFDSAPGDTDWYAIQLEAGKAYTFAATDTAAAVPGQWGNFKLNMYDAGGNLLVNAPGPDNDSIAYYATTSGRYYVGIGHYYARPYSLHVDLNTDVFGNSSTYSTLAVGGTAHSKIDQAFDDDWFRVELVAGQSYLFSVTPEGDQPIDAVSVRVFRGINDLRATSDDGPGAHDAVVRFTPTESGTYYVSAASPIYNHTGSYAVSAVAVPTQDPVAAITGTGIPVDHNISVYFASQGQAFGGHTATTGWSDLEIQGFLLAGTAWSNVANVTFTQTTSSSDADLILVYDHDSLPAEMVSSKVVVVDDHDTDVLQYFLRYMQASGLALGLIQPDWRTGHEPLEVFPPTDPYLYLPFGTFTLDQRVYTVMSTNSFGWNDNGYYAGSPTGPGALDIAAVQARYGAANLNADDTVYNVTANTAGFSVIWDTGGTDTIQDGALSDLIDLRPATLLNAPGGGGYISKAAGGFVIAHGVMIENASGADGNDTLNGNDGNNTLMGDGGDDRLWGGAGNDILNGGAGFDRADFSRVTNAVTVDLTLATAQDTGEGSDTLTGIEAVTGSGFDDRIRIGAGMSADGGAGSDTLVLTGKPSDYTAAGTGYHGYQLTSSAGVFTFSNFEYLRLDDRTLTESQFLNIALYTGAFIDDDDNGHVLTGTSGKDIINGNGGNDTISGGDGDELSGGSGNDIFLVSGVPAAVSGGDGFDTVTYASSAGGVNATLSGYTGIEQLTGSAYNDNLSGNGDANRIDGGAGADYMAGGNGDDNYYVDNAGDYVLDYIDCGNDAIFAGVSYSLANTYSIEHLFLTGTANIDATGSERSDDLNGNGGKNRLDGGAGADTMAGGAGDDIYVVDEAGDTAVEQAGQGNDTVLSAVNYTLGANFENLTLMNSAGAGTGNALNNVLTGNTVANTLSGNGGNDVLDGGLGADRLYGGAGDDTYVIDDAGDLAIEQKVAGVDDGGIDLVQSSVSYSLAAFVENLTLTGAANLAATGNGLANLLVGNTGNNTLAGGLGADTMSGGLGDDLYYVDNTGDVVIELAGGGTDKVSAGVDNYHLAANVESLVLAGSVANGYGNGGDNTLTGNGGSNVLDGDAGNDMLTGLAGADRMLGGAGNDTYVVDNDGDQAVETHNDKTDDGGADLVQSSVTFVLGAFIENLVLTGGGAINGTGNALANGLTGNTAGNLLNGLGGADTMTGLGGNDTYFIDNAGDVVVEVVGAGIDIVNASINYMLTANVERLYLTGTANIAGTGNSDANQITGNTGNNRLDGGLGADTLIGGLGNDTYTIDDAGDKAAENANEGLDQVNASVSYALGSNVENLMLAGAAVNGTGNGLNNVIWGNDLANRLDGAAGVDKLLGGLGDDTYVLDNASDKAEDVANGGVDLVLSSQSHILSQYVENLTLTGSANITATGNALDNILIGNGGNNRLTGGAGMDAMTGGAGHDTYYVDNIGDTVTEGLNAGIDLVQSYVTFTLSDNVENLFLNGTGDLNGTGNAINNLITGTSGNNILDGAGGVDKLFGGLGDDTYYLDNASDSAKDEIDGGHDVVYSSASWVMTAYIEDMFLTGSANITGTGNALANVLSGNDGNNKLDGGAGNDALTGGLGNDTFVFSANSGVDTITDFTTSDYLSLKAYSHGVKFGGGVTITQSGSDVLIDLGGGNTVTVLNSLQADVASHIFW